MAFKRRFRRTFRRRGRLPETYTIKECRQCFNVYGDMTCLTPFIDIFEVLTMSTPRNATLDPTEVSNPSSKAVVFQGAKFQSLWAHDPLTTQDCLNTGNGATKQNFLLTIWECLMVLPLLQGTTNVPAYLPNLTFPTLQNGDLADRVLWKRLSHLSIQGVASIAGATIVNPDSTARYNTENPVVVKAKCRLDDRHGLYYVRNFVHNVFNGFSAKQPCNSTDCDSCQTSPAFCGEIPVTNDLWMKVFYKVRG